MSRVMKVLLFSSLYPNAAQPVHGLFVERRLLQVLETGRVVLAGPAEEIRKDEAVRRAYLGY